MLLCIEGANFIIPWGWGEGEGEVPHGHGEFLMEIEQESALKNMIRYDMLQIPFF